MKTLLKLEYALISLLLVSLLSCQEDDSASLETKTYTKQLDKIQLGDGNLSLWLQSDKQGKPEVLGLTFSKKAFNNLPQSDDHMANEFILQLRKSEVNLPYDHLGVNWNPIGHPPFPTYQPPHFDFHYYTITEQERHQIAPGDPKLEVLPEAGYLPAGYIPTGGVPMMGNHWIDPASPELKGEKFTHTFIYGSYNGSINFLEPMITLEFIKSRPNARYNIKQPLAFEKAGYHPMQYGVFYDGQKDEYSITLENFVWREATP